jgi:hypothetical protein
VAVGIGGVALGAERPLETVGCEERRLGMRIDERDVTQWPESTMLSKFSHPTLPESPATGERDASTPPGNAGSAR